MASRSEVKAIEAKHSRLSSVCLCGRKHTDINCLSLPSRILKFTSTIVQVFVSSSMSADVVYVHEEVVLVSSQRKAGDLKSANLSR